MVSLLALALLSDRVNALPNENPPHRDIHAVLRAHDREFLKLPNVIGVYVGLLPDEKTPCLKVMLSRETPATEHALPKSIEGYRVVAEVTGEIRPLQ
jgi:hypothetical protein